MSYLSNIPWFKILGFAVLIHIMLIAITILEVFIYSTLINPGKEQSFYESHAQLIAPYVAIIIGFILMFWFARIIVKNMTSFILFTTLLLAATYVLTDVLILVASDVNWSEHFMVFAISFTTKFLAAYLAGISIIKSKNSVIAS